MRTRAVRPRWTWLFMRSTACWSWDARATSASPEPGRGWGDCVHTPDRCTTLQRRRCPLVARDLATSTMRLTEGAYLDKGLYREIGTHDSAQLVSGVRRPRNGIVSCHRMTISGRTRSRG